LRIVLALVDILGNKPQVSGDELCDGRGFVVLGEFVRRFREGCEEAVLDLGGVEMETGGY
jgi:hypothetical protein